MRWERMRNPSNYLWTLLNNNTSIIGIWQRENINRNNIVFKAFPWQRYFYVSKDPCQVRHQHFCWAVVPLFYLNLHMWVYWWSERGEVCIILHLKMLSVNPVVHQAAKMKCRENLYHHQNLNVIENTVHFLRTLQETLLLMHFYPRDSWHSIHRCWNSWICLLLRHWWRHSWQ